MSNPFKGISGVKATQGSNYLRAGHYYMLLRGVKLGQNRKGRDFVAIEMTCLHVFDDDNGRGHKINEDTTHMLMCDSDPFLPNFKAFVSAALDCDESEINEESCIEITGNDQPLAGLVVEVQGTEIVTQKGNPFTRISYKGAVSEDLLSKTLPQDLQDRYFPDGLGE